MDHQNLQMDEILPSKLWISPKLQMDDFFTWMKREKNWINVFQMKSQLHPNYGYHLSLVLEKILK
jgi:hypothetical protein